MLSSHRRNAEGSRVDFVQAASPLSGHGTMMVMAVIVEPSVSREKLDALLAEGSEHSSLDYKEVLDLGKGSARGIVELAKDVAAMQAEPDGGYIVVGADDHGNPVPGLTPDLACHFDDATLRAKLGKYLTEPEIRVGQHEVNGMTVVLIYVAPHPNGWAIFHQPGDYEHNGKTKTVFRVGDVFVRHGTRSERWDDTDVPRLLKRVIARRKEAWRREFAEDLAAARVGHTADNLAELPAAAITWSIDDETFTQLTTELLRRNDDIPLQKLLLRAPAEASELLGKDRDECDRLLDRLTSFAALCLQYERAPWFDRALRAFERVYELGFDSDGHDRNDANPVRSDLDVVGVWLAVITRIYALGGLAVRLKAWQAVRALAERRPRGRAFDIYGSWLRHAVTMAARANQIGEKKTGLLARAHNTVRNVPTLHPDRPADDEAILNSLCQFDVYGGLVVIGQRGLDDGNYYTNFARYYPQRSEPAFTTIVTDPQARGVLFDGTAQQLADAIATMSRMAGKESFRFNSWFHLNTPTVIDFVNEHKSRELRLT